MKTKSTLVILAVMIIQSLSLLAAGYQDYPTFVKEFRGLSYDNPNAYQVQGYMFSLPYCTIALEDGKYLPLKSLNGKTYGGLFIGSGTFEYSMPALEEQNELKRFFQQSKINSEIEWIMFFSADSTHYKLISGSEKTSFPDKVNSDPLKILITSNLSMNKEIIDGTLSKVILEGDYSNYTYHIVKLKDIEDPLIYQISPDVNEAVQLHRALENSYGYYPQMINRYFLADRNGKIIINERDNNPVSPIKYKLDIEFDVNLFSKVNAEIQCKTRTNTGNWIITNSFPRSNIEDVRINGEKVYYFNDKYYPIMFIRIPKNLEPNTDFTISMKYSGAILFKSEGVTLARNIDYWYPKFGNNNKSIFEINAKYLNFKNIFKAVGEEVNKYEKDGAFYSRWVTKEPVLAATIFIAPYEIFNMKTKNNTDIDVVHYHSSEKNMYMTNVQSMLGFTNLLFGPLERQKLNFIFNASPVQNLIPGTLTVTRAFLNYYNLDIGAEITKLYFADNFELRSDRDFWIMNGIGQYLAVLYTQNIAKQNDMVNQAISESADYQLAQPNTITSLINKYPSTIILNRDQQSDIFENNTYRYNNYVGNHYWINHNYSLSDATSGSLTPYFNIKYVFDKSGWVFQMLRHIMIDYKTMDDKVFVSIIRDFFAKYKGKVISTDDFINHIETSTNFDFTWFFDQWLRGYDLPIYTYAYKIEQQNGKYVCRLKVKQEDVPANFKMLIPVCLKFDDKNYEVSRIMMTGDKVVSMDLPPTDKKPDEITFNYMTAVLCKAKKADWNDLK